MIISKILDIRKADIDKEFLDLVDKVVFEENKEKNEFRFNTKRF